MSYLEEEINTKQKKVENIGNRSWIVNLMKKTGQKNLDPVRIIETLDRLIEEQTNVVKFIKQLPVVQTLSNCFKYYTRVNKYLVSSLIRIEFNQKE